jgi:hypothetical protein
MAATPGHGSRATDVNHWWLPGAGDDGGAGQAGGRQRHGWAAAVVTVRAGGQPRRRQFFGADARTVVLCQVLAPGRTLGFSIGFT